MADYRQQIATLHQQVVQLYRQGLYAQAVQPATAARDLTRQYLGEGHPDYATSLNNLALLYQSMGNYSAAEPLYRQARDICRVALGEDHPDYATSRDLGVAGSFGGAGLGGGAALENPLLRSGLALASANWRYSGFRPPPEAEDGLLTAEDVVGLDLLNTELVVLSACDTGLGKVQVGEGVYGLRRAFVLAGARTLVMSLWKVPDAATQELMVQFYTHLLAGKGRAESLRLAQRELRKKYPHPYFWGAFICQGDPGPLQFDMVAPVSR